MKTIHLKGNFADRAFFIYDCAQAEFVKFLTNKYSKKYPELEFKEESGISGIVEGFDIDYKPYYYVWVETIGTNRKEIRLSVIHEILHLINHIARHIGVQQNLGSEEFFTYLQGSYCEQIFNKLFKKQYEHRPNKTLPKKRQKK